MYTAVATRDGHEPVVEQARFVESMHVFATVAEMRGFKVSVYENGDEQSVLIYRTEAQPAPQEVIWA